MIVTGTTGAEFKDFRVEVEPEDYDGYPVIPDLIIESQPHKLSPELIAVAATLAFRPYLSTISLKKAISPTCARAIANYTGETSLAVQPISLKATAFFEPGHKELLIASPSLDCPAPDAIDPSQLVLYLTDRTVSFGYSVTGSTFQVATNAYSLGRHVSTSRDRRALALACGVLLAPSMGCRGICVTGPRDDDLIPLINSTGLAMRFADSSDVQ